MDASLPTGTTSPGGDSALKAASFPLFSFFPLCYNGPMQDLLLPELRSALDPVSLLGQEAALLAAVSGGGDSVALLHALAALRREVGFRLGAVHVDHGLRGSRSRGDAAFVQALCRDLEVPLLLYQARLPGSMEGPGVEERARRARRAFYLRAMEEARADAVLWPTTGGPGGNRADGCCGGRGPGLGHAPLPFGNGVAVCPSSPFQEPSARLGPGRELLAGG